jgi:hypothetical protein
MKNKLIDKSEIFDINNSYVDSQRIIEDKEKKIFDMEIESKENKQKLMNLLNKANSEIKKQKKECENKISFVEKMNNINNKKLLEKELIIKEMKKNHQEEISKLKKLFEDTQLLINEKEKQFLKMDKELST